MFLAITKFTEASGSAAAVQHLLLIIIFLSDVLWFITVPQEHQKRATKFE